MNNNRLHIANLILVPFLLIGSVGHAVEIGSAAPNCALTAFTDSGNADLKQYQGGVLYVDFWASWCGPCAKSFPFLNSLHERYKGQGLHIVGVNLDENLDDAKAFLNNYPANFTVVADVSKQCAKDFAVKAMPSSYVIDRKGIVHHVHLGFKSGESEELKMLVEKLLSESVAKN